MYNIKKIYDVYCVTFYFETGTQNKMLPVNKNKKKEIKLIQYEFSRRLHTENGNVNKISHTQHTHKIYFKYFVPRNAIRNNTSNGFSFGQYLLNTIITYKKNQVTRYPF